MLERAFDDNTTPGDFLTEILPAIHQVRHQDFLAWVDGAIDVVVHVKGEPDGPWHVVVDRKGLVASPVSTPPKALLAIEFEREDWYGFKGFLAGFIAELDTLLHKSVPPPSRRINDHCRDMIAALDATLHVVVEGIFSDGPATCTVHLGKGNSEGKSARIELHADDVEDSLDRVVTPLQLYRDRRLTFSGETAVLARLGTILAPHLPFELG